MPSVIGQFGVDLVRYDDDIVMFPQYSCNRFQMFPAHDASGRVIRERQNQHLGFRGDCRFQFLSRQPEIVFLFQRNRNRYAIGQRDYRRISNIARFGNQYLVSSLDKGTCCKVNSLTSADCDHDLMGRVVFQRKTITHIVRNRFSQLRKSGVCGITGVAALQIIDCSPADGVRRLEIGFTDAKGYHPFHLVGNIKKTAYP